jgi:hypothetical protein
MLLNKFKVDEYPRAMRRLLHLRQRGGVEDYVQDFEEARYICSSNA